MTARSSVVSAAHSVGNTATRKVLTDLPGSCKLAFLHGEVSAIAGGATSITVRLSADSGGDIPFYIPGSALTIAVGETTATDGGVFLALDLDYVTLNKGTSGSVWVSATTDAGTCTVAWELLFTEDA